MGKVKTSTCFDVEIPRVNGGETPSLPVELREILEKKENLAK